MIRWLVQSIVDHPDLSAGRPPAGLLTAAEAAQHRGYLSPRRRRDWLLGRWTAKRLVQTHFIETEGFCPAPGSFGIEQYPSGAPYVYSEHPALYDVTRNGQVPVVLSISHSHGYAFCALFAEEKGYTRLGVDIELVEQRSSNFAQEFFTPEEQSRLNRFSPALIDLVLTATWSAKEAALKATHSGLRADPQRTQCLLRPERPRLWRPFRVEMQADQADTARAGALRGWWRVLENRLRLGHCFVLTIVAQGVTL
jgi:4'-phosphopantetheinyl transferase